MKKTILIFSALLLGGVAAAQGGAERAPKTIVADVLAQMPAPTGPVYEKLMADLASVGTDGVLMLVDQRSAPGAGSNAKVDDALSGLTWFATKPEQEALRPQIEQAYLRALSGTNERETQAFLIRQLQMIGSDASVPALSGYLTDASLCGPAARALATIGGPAAVKALRSALGTVENGVCRTDLANAAACIGCPCVEPELLALMQTGDAALKQAVLFALSRCGTARSLPVLAAEAERVGYALDKSGAVQAYVVLLKKLEKEDPNRIRKAAGKLLKAADKAGVDGTECAALSLLMRQEGADRVALAAKALKSPSCAYRCAALSNLTVEEVPAMAAKLKSAKPAVQVDLLNWLAVQRDIRALDAVLPMLKSNDKAVMEAAVRTVRNTGGDRALQALVGLLKSADADVVTTVRNALLSFDGDIVVSVAQAVEFASPAGQVAAVDVLAARRAVAQSPVVFAAVASGDPVVRQAALQALSSVVSGSDMDRLCMLLESAAPEELAPLQGAVAAALADRTQAEQLAEIEARMEKSGAKNSFRYLPVLSAVRGDRALVLLVGAFGSEDPATKASAFGSLEAWNGFDAVEPLFAVCKDPASSAYFDRAMDAVVDKIAVSGLPGEKRLIFLRNAFDLARTDAQKNKILYQVQQTGTLQGLLFAARFLEEEPLRQAACRAVMNIALYNPQHNGKNVRAYLTRVIDLLEGPDAGYERQAVRDALAERPDEAGFVSIFNGKDLTGWKGLVENPIVRAKMKPAALAKAQQAADERARQSWMVDEAGNLVFRGSGDNLCTDDSYGDFEMYIDWKLDPEGPEPDAGIYLRGTPQVQIWDTSRVNVGAQVGSGGLYNNQVNPDKPLQVADNRLGEWNTFYIKMVGERVTVCLNGVPVVDNAILENFWDRNLPIFPEEQIELQAHGSKVYYRDILVKRLPRTEPYRLSDEERNAGFRALFDGLSMHEWTGNTTDYVAENGTIALYPKNGGGGNLYTKKEFGDFVLRFDFQLTPGANNGLGIRTPLEGDAAYAGMELQILDNEDPVYASLAPYQYHGSVYGIIPAKRGFLKPVGEWNTQEVIAKGNRIQVILNGETILDGNIREAVKSGTPDGNNHPGLFNKKGHIGFLGHGSEVKFRNIRIRELK